MALDNRRNSEVTHLQFDYRNACAMLNFVHKPCCADGDLAQEIGERLKQKCSETKINILENLLKLRIGTKKTPLKNFTELVDFPKLTEYEMETKLFFGSYYIKQSKSYLGDLLKNENFSSMNENVLPIPGVTANVLSELKKEWKNLKIKS